MLAWYTPYVLGVRAGLLHMVHGVDFMKKTENTPKFIP